MASPMAGTLARRAVLLGALAVACGGCASGQRRPNAASAACSRVTTLPIYVPLATDAEASAFKAADPVLYPLPSRDQWACARQAGHEVCYPSHAANWGIATASGWQPPYHFYPLDAALHAANLDPGTLLPHTLDAFRYDGVTWGLPGYVTPVGVAYRPDVFSAAHLPPPAAEWTLAEFEAACARIQGLAQGGKIAGCYGPLPPAVGSGLQALNAPPAWSLLTPALWTGFIAGYGGWMVQGSRFELTNPGALRGVAALARICRLYAAPGARLRAQVAPGEPPGEGAAMLFQPYLGPPGGTPAGAGLPGLPQAARPRYPRRFARFPVLPVVPAVPATVSGWLLPGDPTTTSAPARAIDAVVRFALWSYARVGQHPTAPGPPPVLADAAVQRAYWGAAAQRASGAQAVGAPAHYAYVDQGFPPLFQAAGPILYQALAPVVTESASLTAALGAATQKLNAAAARYRTDKRMQAQARQERAQAFGRFGAAVPLPHTATGPIVRICRH